MPAGTADDQPVRLHVREQTSTERQREDFDSDVKELDFKGASGDWSRLPNQLMQSLLDRDTAAFLIDV